jgi:hypothetical protein
MLQPVFHKENILVGDQTSLVGKVKWDVRDVPTL